MRLTLIGPVYPYRGGIAWFTTSLGHELLSAGHQIQIVSFSRQYPSWLYPGKSDKDPSQQHVQVSAQFLLDPIYPHTWMRAIRQIKQFDPQLVIIQWWTTFWAPAFWSISRSLQKRKIPVAFIVHNVMPHEARFFDRWLVRETLKHGNALIYLSPLEGERLKNLLPDSRFLPSTLPIFKISQTHLDRSIAKQKLGLTSDQKVLLFFGLVRPYKGLSVLLNALEILHEEGIKPILIVVGEFWEDPEAYFRQIHNLSLADQVRIENRYVPNEEVGVYFSAADGFVAPYIEGTQSAAIKVAMGYQIPILASDKISGDLPLTDYPVFVHPSGDVVELAASIRRFLRESPSQTTPKFHPHGWQDTILLIEQLCAELSG
jgi:glycosyltransferase involved in cell wall biosynthesis